MTVFRYVSVTEDGIRRSGQISATGEAEARQMLMADGDLLISLRRGDTREWLKLEIRRTTTLEDAAAFAAELAGLLQAGAPLRKALGIQAEGNQAQSKLARSVLRQLENGRSLSAALRQEGPNCALLAEFSAAGEAGAGLDALLQTGAHFLEARQRAVAQVRNALAYPAFIAVLAVVALAVVTIYVAPAMAPILRDAGQDSFLLRMAAVGSWCQANSTLLLASAACVVGLLYLAARQDTVKRSSSRLIWSAPLIGSLVRDLEVAQSTEILSALLDAGSSVEVSLKFAASVSGPHLAATYLRLAEQIRDGKPASAAFQEETELPHEVRRLAMLGERSSALPQSLRQAGRLCMARARRRIDLFAATVGPFLVIGLGGAVALLMLTVLSTLSSIGDPGL